MLLNVHYMCVISINLFIYYICPMKDKELILNSTRTQSEADYTTLQALYKWLQENLKYQDKNAVSPSRIDDITLKTKCNSCP